MVVARLDFYSHFTAVRDDRYFFAGRSIAVSLVHGGPPPCFLSETLFSCLVKGPEMSRPVIEDIADNELYEKLKRVCGHFYVFYLCNVHFIL